MNSPQDDATAWYVVECSVRGASHERLGKPNQDAVGGELNRGNDSVAVFAVADGHGGERYVRSGDGSRFAVEAAKQALIDFLLKPAQPDFVDGYPDLRERRQLALEWLPVEITRRWRALVKQHASEHPWTENEAPLIGRLVRDLYDEQSVLRSYGTTLIAVMITPDFVLYSQIGDGDILIVDESGNVERPIADELGQIGDVTQSLAGMDAWNDFRVEIFARTVHSPKLVLACTDGYSKSFATDEDFEKVALDLAGEIESSGIQTVEQSLPTWLAETSASGSGDDISVAIAWAVDKPDVSRQEEDGISR